MFDRSLRVRSVVAVGVAVAGLAIAAPLAVADPAPRFIPHTQTARLGGGPSPTIRDRLGEIGAWAVPSLRSQTPRLEEGLTGADRSWLTPSASEPHVTGPHVTSPPNGFDWGDAGIGAGAAAAVLLVATGSAVAIRRRVSPAH